MDIFDELKITECELSIGEPFLDLVKSRPLVSYRQNRIFTLGDNNLDQIFNFSPTEDIVFPQQNSIKNLIATTFFLSLLDYTPDLYTTINSGFVATFVNPYYEKSTFIFDNEPNPYFKKYISKLFKKEKTETTYEPYKYLFEYIEFRLLDKKETFFETCLNTAGLLTKYDDYISLKDKFQKSKKEFHDIKTGTQSSKLHILRDFNEEYLKKISAKIMGYKETRLHSEEKLYVDLLKNDILNWIDDTNKFQKNSKSLILDEEKLCYLQKLIELHLVKENFKDVSEKTKFVNNIISRIMNICTTEFAINMIGQALDDLKDMEPSERNLFVDARTATPPDTTPNYPGIKKVEELGEFKTPEKNSLSKKLQIISEKEPTQY